MSSATSVYRKPLILLIDNSHEDFQLLTEACREFDLVADVELILDPVAVIPHLETAQLHESSQRTPCLILLDVILPMANGHDLLRRIKSDARFSHIPVIMYTSSPRHEDRRFSMAHGAIDYWTKPTAFDEYGPLVSMLKDLIEVEPEHTSDADYSVTQ